MLKTIVSLGSGLTKLTHSVLHFIMLAAFCLLVLLSVVQSANAGSLIPNTYDSEFKDAVDFLPAGTDWKLLKAQCWQESRLQPLAVSPAGAYGLCQFMPGTASDITASNPELNDFWLPEVSITAAGLYMGKMHRFWSYPRPAEDRYKLSLASYNAGAGNILKSQNISGGAVLYEPIIRELHHVTGHHSKETKDYVHLITEKWYPLIYFG